MKEARIFHLIQILRRNAGGRVIFLELESTATFLFNNLWPYKRRHTFEHNA